MNVQEQTTGTSLFARMAAIDLATPRKLSLEPVKASDTVLGLASEEIRRLYCLRVDLIGKYEEMMAEVNAKGEEHVRTHDDVELEGHDCAEFWKSMEAGMGRINELKSELESVTNIIRAAVELEFPAARKVSLGMREGWQIVTTESEVKRELNEMLAGLEMMFGGRVKIVRV